jgi:hypothetical protein
MAKTADRPLADAIAELLRDAGRTAAALETMLDRVAPEAERLAARAAQVRDDALDPRLAAAEVLALRAAADEADWERARIERAAEVLTREIAERRDAEAEADRRARYDAAKAERDRVADLLRQRWPGIVAEALELIADIGRAAKMSEAANADLPEGAEALAHPQMIAGGFTGPSVYNGNFQALLIERMVLPSLAGHVVWPIQEGLLAPQFYNGSTVTGALNRRHRVTPGAVALARELAAAPAPGAMAAE